jgi:putative membrane-bound dehydrogenase-like protein
MIGYRRRRSPKTKWLLWLLAARLLDFGWIGPAVSSGDELPHVHDRRLHLSLVAEAPDIVTPTGVAVDEQGVIFVVESHTHFPPEDYEGPPVDRIKRLKDTTGDGRADQVTVFYEGGRATMNLAIDHRGLFYVATRGEIFTLRDTNGDGRADERQLLARLETDGDYPHNGLSGFAFDFLGNIYFGLGENLGETYELIARDGSTHAGGGEGGSIFRMKADGSDLERFATGFWNPFHLAFDTHGRLFAVDNDPDSRPPCRLLHVVQHGDYGYRFRNGRRGTHPFTAWFGELPGTLGLAAETGEAPSGVLAYESDGLPSDYLGKLLATSWGDHEIQAFSLEPRGATFVSQARTLVKGDRNFRPVAIALAPDGSLILSDWVDRSYTLHGKGRVWRLAGTNTAPVPLPRRPDLDSRHRPAREAAARRVAAGATNDAARIRQLENVSDPRIRAALVGFWAGSTPSSDDESEEQVDDNLPETTREATAPSPGQSNNTGWLDVARNDDSADVAALALTLVPNQRIPVEWLERQERSPLVRAAALQHLRGERTRNVLLAHLDNEDPFTRHAAFTRLKRDSRRTSQAIWDEARSDRQREYAALLLRDRDDAEGRALIPTLLDDTAFPVNWVAIQWIGEQRLTEFREPLEERLFSGQYPGALLEGTLAALHQLDGEPPAAFETQGEQLLSRLLQREDLPAPLLTLVLQKLPPRHEVLAPRWAPLLKHSDPSVRLQAVRSYRETDTAGRLEILREIAFNQEETAAVRGEAVAGLDPDHPDQRQLLFRLLESSEPVVGRQAARGFRAAEISEQERAELSEREIPDEVRELFRQLTVTQEDREARPRLEVDIWMQRIGESLESDPESVAEGERIFFHPRGPGCQVCHRIQGRGGDIGPDLTDAGNMGMRKLLESIVHPSAEIAPQYVTWALQLKDGRQQTGMLVTERGDQQTYADAEGNTFVVHREEIELRRPLTSSLMPDQLVETMTLSELRSLLAFLRERR